jgi:hypothetical protein
MKTTKFISALIAIFALAFLSTLESCSIQEEVAENQTSSFKSSLLSNGGWVLLSATKDMGAPEGELDMYFFMSETEKSDVLYFYPNNNTVKTSVVFNSGKVATSPSMKGSWKLSDNEQTLILTSGSVVTELTIETLNENELVVSTTEYDAFLGKNVKSTFGYKS